MRAATTPAMTLKTSVTITATITAGAIAPMSLGRDRQAEPEEEDRREHVAQRHEQLLDPVPEAGAGDDHARQQRADRVRRARVVREAGGEDAEADDQDHGELGVAGGDERAHQARAPASQREQPDQERERDRDRERDLARPLRPAEDRLQQREVEREEDVLDDDDPEDHPRLRVLDPARSRISLVTIAVDDVPIMPAITKISRVPHPSAQPSTRPAPKFSAM